MFIVAKTIKGKEFIYSNNYSILCKNEIQAKKLAKHLNENNDSAVENWKLKENELWFVYEIDNYSAIPTYRLRNTKNSIKIAYNI